MAFFQSAVGVLKVLVIALGAGLGVWGVINLMEGRRQQLQPRRKVVDCNDTVNGKARIEHNIVTGA